MLGKQSKTVQFSNLSEDHKAEFLQFLIKNNICFQEGKENCTAKIAIKESNHGPSHKKEKPTRIEYNKPRHSGAVKDKRKLKERKSNVATTRGSIRPLKERVHNNAIENKENNGEDKELKTPTKNTGRVLRTSSLSCKSGSQTLQKNQKLTPKSVKPQIRPNDRNNTIVSEYDTLTKSSFKGEDKKNFQFSKEKQHSTTHDKNQTQRQLRKHETHREKPVNRYHKLFQSVDKGRAVRWPLSVLEKAIEQIYDSIFMKNTQCLQTRSIDNALKTLNLSTFPQLIEHYFMKKFKNNKIASTNLNNLLNSLSYHVSKNPPPAFLKTFQDFLLDNLQHEDILFYLFARNVMKKELKAVQKHRDIIRNEGTYFPEYLRPKDISRMLKAIIGQDSELLREYKAIISKELIGDQIEVYSFLKVLLDDFHQRRVCSFEAESEVSDHPLFQRDLSYDQRNEQLTFGEQHNDHSEIESHPQFWECLKYSHVEDSLFELIMEKMSRKSMEFLQILGGDLGKEECQLQRLHQMVLGKAQSLSLAVFEMNKMKWLKELSITNPSQEDIATVQKLQMQLRKLRQSPSGRDIGQFCKSILTVRQLVNELQYALTTYD